MTKNTAIKIGIVLAVLAAAGTIAAIGLVFLVDKWQRTTLASSQSGITPQQKASLDEALKAGVITQDEYNAKLRPVASAAAPPSPGRPSAAATDPAKVKWTVVTVSDPMFNMPAYKVKIPADWKFEGAVVRTNCEGAMLVYRTESPDGLTGVQVMPHVHWTYSQNPQVLRQANQACHVHPPVPSAQQAPEIVAAARPQPEILSIAPLTQPEVAGMYAKDNQVYENQARASGNPNAAGHESGDAVEARIRYSYQGHAEEEIITVSTTVTDAAVAVTGSGANGIIQPGWAHAQRTDTYVSGVRAPLGTLDASMPLLKGVLMAMIPDYDKAVLAFNNQQFQQVEAIGRGMFGDTLKAGEVAHQNLMAQHQAYSQWQQQSYANERQQFQVEMNNKTAQNKNFVDYVSNQTYYMNPETGATATVKDVPGADGVTRSVNGGWVQLQPISH